MEDLSLTDPTRVALDDELRQLCETFRTRPAGLRNALTTDDLYLLLAFARRAALFAIRNQDPAWIADGLTAVAMVDDERVDRRDLEPTLGLLRHAAARIGADAGALFAEAARQATRSVGRAIRSDTSTYDPSHDLLQTALNVGAILERDGYRVEDVTLGSLPPVWFDTPPRTTGVVAVHARHRDDPEQMAIAFIAEMLAAAPPRSGASDVSMIAVGHDDLLCLVIARVETIASLQRFVAPVRHALSISPVTPTR